MFLFNFHVELCTVNSVGFFSFEAGIPVACQRADLNHAGPQAAGGSLEVCGM